KPFLCCERRNEYATAPQQMGKLFMTFRTDESNSSLHSDQLGEFNQGFSLRPVPYHDKLGIRESLQDKRHCMKQQINTLASNQAPDEQDFSLGSHMLRIWSKHIHHVHPHGTHE